MPLTDYNQSTGNWREQLHRNKRKTQFVIGIFFLTYITVGLLTDVAILISYYPSASLQDCITALIHFQPPPYATLLMIGGAFVALFVTYALYDRIMLLGTTYREITPQTAQTGQEKQLYNIIEEMKIAAGLSYMPKVFLIEANYMNAFASGYSEKSAMIAITRGLMEKLDRSEMQAVLSHELSHIRHQDIKLTLTVAVLSNILLIVIDLLFYSMLYKQEDDRRNNKNNRLLFLIVMLRYLLPFITLILTLFLSRTREYMADAGAVELMRNNEPMARALLKISEDHQQHASQYTYDYGNTPHEEIRQAAYLFDPSSLDPIKSLQNVFSTHPSIEQRLSALGYRRKNK